MESTSSESQSAAEELEGFGRSFLRAMSSPLSPEEKLQYRTGSTGYWVALLLPLALYIGDLDNDKATITAVAIISLNAVLLCVLQLFDLNLNYILLRMRRLNIALSGTILAIGFFHEGKSSKLMLLRRHMLTIQTLLNFWSNIVFKGDLYKVAAYLALHFTFPYVFYNMIKQHPRSFTFGEGVLVNSAITFKFWIASQSLPFPEHTVSMKDIREPEMISLFLDVSFAFHSTYILLIINNMLNHLCVLFSLIANLFCCNLGMSIDSPHAEALENVCPWGNAFTLG